MSAASFARSRYLLPGCTRPTDAAVEAFFADALRALGPGALPNDFTLRWIGADADSTAAILRHVFTGDKTGTVSLPEVNRANGHGELQRGDALLLIDYDGSPAAVLQITDVEVVPFGQISERHTALDGPRVREPAVWLPLHRRYFDVLLEALGRRCDDDTPVAFERFRLVYPELQT